MVAVTNTTHKPKLLMLPHFPWVRVAPVERKRKPPWCVVHPFLERQF